MTRVDELGTSVTESPTVPVAKAYLRRVEPQFDLPHRIGPQATLASVDQIAPSAGRRSASIPEGSTHVLEIHGVEEHNAIVHAANVISTIRLASQCSVELLNYVFSSGLSIDATEVHAPIWGHYDCALQLDDVAWVEEHLEVLQPYHIPASYSRIGNALRLYDAALHTRNADLALLGFVGAIESLFSIAPQELSFRLSLLLARFLGDESKSQRDYFERAKSLYAIRSKIAHGDKLHRNEEAAAVQLVEHWTPQAEELARLSLRQVFQERVSDIFDSRMRHEVFLVNLLFEVNLHATIAKDRDAAAGVEDTRT